MGEPMSEAVKLSIMSLIIVDRVRAENAELRKQLTAERDAAVRNDKLRKMAERLGAGYEQEYLDDPLSGALRSENESMQELSDRLRGAME